MKEPIPTYTYLINRLAGQFNNLTYLHVVEPRTLPDGSLKEVKPGQV